MTDNSRHAEWEGRYGPAAVWSGKVNHALQAWGADPRPQSGDRALDLACGEGGDALWLAQQGWQVTGVDFATAAIARAATSASQQGLEVTWITADITDWTPPTKYQLVCLSFFHEPRDVRHAVWDVAAAAVAEGGTLLITAHAPDPDPAAPGPPADTRFDVGEIVDRLGKGWALNYHEARREAMGRHAGQVLTDMVVELHRRAVPESPEIGEFGL